MNTMEKLPREIQDRLKERLGLHNFETWIKPLMLAQGAGGEITIEVPSTLFRDWLNENYLEAIKDEFARHYGKPVRIVLSVKPSGNGHDKPPPGNPAPRPAETSTLIPRYTFENFVVGTSNQFAHAACLAVASGPADHYNPLFIYGGVGLGKTHLVNALGNRLLEQGPGQKIIYTTFESFMNRPHHFAPAGPHERVQEPFPQRRRAHPRRHPVHRGQGENPGRVLPHVQLALREP